LVFNAAAEQMFGSTEGEAIVDASSDLSLSDFATRQRTFAVLAREKRKVDGCAWSPVWTARRRRGVSDNVISQLNSNGQTLYTVILRDITYRKQAEDALHE
jgi:PAS domain S-box-containing protein